ncbi:MAG: hypothetical protein Q7W16_07060 [Coriobacteriia bacterium]|nr:hypothetical protein [Coriobacteriia bacterium]
MSGYTKDEALEFVESIRVLLGDRTGFQWLVGRLSQLTAYIETTAAENERLNAYLDRTNARDDYEAQSAIGSDASDGSRDAIEG